MDSETKINNAIELRHEVEEMLHEPEYIIVLPTSILTITLNDMHPSDLCSSLFRVFTICEDFKAYDNLNERNKASCDYVQSTLHDKSVVLRTSVFRQCDNWFDS